MEAAIKINSTVDYKIQEGILSCNLRADLCICLLQIDSQS